MTAPTLSDRVLAGDLRAIARAITLIEEESHAGDDLIRRLFLHTGRAYLIGVTGPPGAGKSTLVDRLTAALRQSGSTVGIVAVDPSSPFTGGAILGDRVRMQAHAGDSGVFIRSMATRGHLGGLARATAEAALVLDAAGRDFVIIETVGVGQDEVDIVRTADVSIVTLVPGAGDEVQALKAGVMEIADIFVINKADREGADRTKAILEAMLSLRGGTPGAWQPPIVLTEATTGRGVDQLVDAIGRFRDRTRDRQEARRRSRAEYRLKDLLAQRFLQHVEERARDAGALSAVLDRIAARQADPYSAADAIAGQALSGADPGRDERRASRGGPVLEHVGIAVPGIADALTFYRDALGLPAGPLEEVGDQRVRVSFLPAGGAALELLEATSEESPIARFLARRGPGLHHVTLRVDDIQGVLQRLQARGVRLIDETPRPGAHGSLVAFVHPASAHGVLLELMQGPAGRVDS